MAATARVMKARVLIDNRHYRPRVARFMQSLLGSASSASFDVSCTKRPRAFDGLLVVYGVGHPDIARAVSEHIGRGYRAVCWDVGYWGKSFRMAIDGHHPTALPPVSADRFDRQNIQLRDDHDPRGHIVLVGLGPKSRYMDTSWEERALQQIKQAYPRRRVLYRPKPRREYVPLPVETDWYSPIEDVLRGAALVVTRHSNVGVDACIAGVPVVAEMGAPSLLYGSDLLNPIKPTEDERRDFLRRLAWWQWRDDEALTAEPWRWIRRALASCHSNIG